MVLLELLAVVSAGVFGVILARQKQLDFVGVFCVAFIAAFGGGTLRDVLLNRHPLFWIEHHQYPVIIFCLALVTSLIRRWPGWMQIGLKLADALGLGLFSVVGASYALAAETSLFVAALFGVITGTFGGVMGDIVCNEVPHLFRPTAPLYATCSFIGAWVFLLLPHAGATDNFAMWAGAATTVALRLIALRWDLRLPESKPTESS